MVETSLGMECWRWQGRTTPWFMGCFFFLARSTHFGLKGDMGNLLLFACFHNILQLQLPIGYIQAWAATHQFRSP